MYTTSFKQRNKYRNVLEALNAICFIFYIKCIHIQSKKKKNIMQIIDTRITTLKKKQPLSIL